MIYYPICFKTLWTEAFYLWRILFTRDIWPVRICICLLALAYTHAFMWYTARQTSRPLSSIAIWSSLPNSTSIPLTNECKGSEVMTTAYVHHSIAGHRQVSVCTYIYTEVHIHMRQSTSGRFGYWEIMVSTKEDGLWDAECVTVLMRTFPVPECEEIYADEVLIWCILILHATALPS